jgi:tRNA(adenine34) deaminase
MDYETLMHLALDEARKSGSDVPVGAVIVNSAGEVISSGHNQKEAKHDASSHAEIEAIRAAGERFGDWRLENTTLVVSLEPCVMCAGAIVAARIKTVVFAAWDTKAGAAGSIYDILRDHRLGMPIEVLGGVLEQESTALIEGFFRRRRLN